MVDRYTGFDGLAGYVSWCEGMSLNFRNVADVLRSQLITIVNNVADLIVDILPVALPVLGIAIAVFFGVRFIKKVMK